MSKHLIRAGGLALLLALPLLADEIKIGESRAAVVKALGRPQGRIMQGEREILTYDRGTVELKNGSVSSFTT